MAPLLKIKLHSTLAQINQARQALRAAWSMGMLAPWRIPALLRFIHERNAEKLMVDGTAVARAAPFRQLAWVRTLLPFVKVVTFPRSTKPLVSFLVDAATQGDDMALLHTLSSLQEQN